MFSVKVFFRKDQTEKVGTDEGQGSYKYKTFNNFKKYVLDNPSKMLFHTYRNPEFFLIITQVTDDGQSTEVLNNGPRR